MKYTAHEHLVPHESLAAEAHSGTTDGASAEKKSAREALIVASLSAATDIQFKIMHSDDDVTFEDYDGPNAVAGSGLSVAIDAAGIYVGRVDLEGAKKFVRVTSVGAGTGYALMVFGNSAYLPVEQANDLLFNIQ